MNYPLAHNSDSYNLIIPERVEFKIREWCKLNPTTEWSGTLFYIIEGDFQNKNIKFIIKDFYVMDIGTSGYTNYKETPEICSYMMDYDLLDCKTGLIHSHNNMKAFFSGTDQGTLAEEGNRTTHYLSLVVNNEGSYVARVTRKITEMVSGVKHIKYLSYDGINIEYDEEVTTTETTKVEYFDLNVCIEDSFTDIRESVKSRYDELKKASPVIINSQFNLQRFRGEDYEEYSWPIQATKGILEEKPKELEGPKITPCSPQVQKEEKEKEKTEVLNLDGDYDLSEYYNFYIGDDAATEYAAQLLYGNIILSGESFKKFTKVNEWITSNMETAFRKRFGNGDIGKSNYEDWMSQYCESLIWGAASEYMETFSTNSLDISAYIVSKSIIEVIEDLVEKAYEEQGKVAQPNYYITYILECLESYSNI